MPPSVDDLPSNSDLPLEAPPDPGGAFPQAASKRNFIFYKLIHYRAVDPAETGVEPSWVWIV